MNHRLRHLFLIIAAPSLLLAANSDGCGVEVAGDDTAQTEWETPPPPEPIGPDRPMTCEWLEGDNCWKQFLRSVRDCAPSTTGELDEERESCVHDGGERLEFEVPISPQGKGTYLPVVDHRFLDAEGDPCFTAKILSPFKSAFSGAGETLVMEGKDLISYRVICPDGTSYSSNAEGSCPSIGARWLAQEIPGYLYSCGESTGTCRATLQGAGPGSEPETLASCRFGDGTAPAGAAGAAGAAGVGD